PALMIGQNGPTMPPLSAPAGWSMLLKSWPSRQLQILARMAAHWSARGHSLSQTLFGSAAGGGGGLAGWTCGALGPPGGGVMAARPCAGAAGASPTASASPAQYSFHGLMVPLPSRTGARPSFAGGAVDALDPPRIVDRGSRPRLLRPANAPALRNAPAVRFVWGEMVRADGTPATAPGRPRVRRRRLA